MRKISIFIAIFVFVLISSVSIGYSAFSTNLAISGDALLRVDSDVRITNLELIDKQNGAFEKYNSEFSKNITSMFVIFPNVNSSVTYRVTVTNKTSYYFTPGEIKAVINSNPSVSYVIEGIEEYGAYQGSNYTFLIKINTTAANQGLNLSLKYDFKAITESSWDFSYKGDSQSFNTLYKAKYRIELWGASGGGDDMLFNYALPAIKQYAGHGAYTAGTISLPHNKNLYIYVGGAGKNVSLDNQGTLDISKWYWLEGGYNGGGRVFGLASSSGGGATDVRIDPGNWDDFSSLKSRIMVAGGGGGIASHSYWDKYGYSVFTQYLGGSAGGLVGYRGYSVTGGENVTCHESFGCVGNGGEQTKGGITSKVNGEYDSTKIGYGSFGAGGFGYGRDFVNTYGFGSGGGSGYYGGSGTYGCEGAGGGSSFISGHSGCNAISSSSTSTNIVHTGSANHYSGYVFENTKIIDGKGYEWTNSKGSLVGTPLVNGNTTNDGHVGDGYARITLIPLN